MTTNLKLLLRNFYRNRSYTLLNLFGLSMGFAVFMLSMIYVYYETHFEDFHLKADKIYRATYLNTSDTGFKTHWARIPFDYINELPHDVQGVKSLIRFQNHARKYVRVGTEKFSPAHAYVTDKEVFSVFNFMLIAGDPATALAQPYSVVLTKSLARKYFGDQDPIGKEIFVIGDLDNDETLHHITGLMEDLPSNTHLPVEMLISFKNEKERSGWAYTYIQLDEGTGIGQVESRMSEFIKKYSTANNAKYDQIEFQPLSSIHLNSNLAREIIPNGKAFYVEIVGLAGILILGIALINFINLNGAMALGRAREIGMRKILGASRQHLVYHLLSETVVSNLVAAGVGAIIAFLAHPLLQSLVPIEFLPTTWKFAVIMILIVIVCGLVACVYPVLLLTSLGLTEIIKTTKSLSLKGNKGALSLKRVMVTLQFSASIILLGSALMAYNQFRFVNDMNLGLSTNQMIAIPNVSNKVTAKFKVFKDQLMVLPGIIGVTGCLEVPSREIRDVGPVLVEGVNKDVKQAPIMDVQIIEQDFALLLGLEFLAGTNITPATGHAEVPEFTDDYPIQKYLIEQPREYIINETAMRELGWKSPEEAVGQKISWSIGDMVLAAGQVKGVVRDFHQETLKNKVDPVIMVNEPVWMRTFLIKVNTGNIDETVQKISATWNSMFPQYPMNYFFLDDLYDNLYRGEKVQIQLLFILSGLAIIIAFIGLVGLVAYGLRTRVKEIALRKVLGATIRELIIMMSREYLIVLLVGTVIAIPVSIYGVSQWLSGFAYHIDISPATYLITLVIISFLLVLTVSLQTLTTSMINPAQTLREE